MKDWIQKEFDEDIKPMFMVLGVELEGMTKPIKDFISKVEKKSIENEREKNWKAVLEWIRYTPMAMSYKNTGDRYTGLNNGLFWLRIRLEKHFGKSLLEKDKNCLHEHLTCPGDIKTLKCAYCNKNMYQSLK